jgi:hypothetical protein
MGGKSSRKREAHQAHEASGGNGLGLLEPMSRKNPRTGARTPHHTTPCVPQPQPCTAPPLAYTRHRTMCWPTPGVAWSVGHKCVAGNHQRAHATTTL